MLNVQQQAVFQFSTVAERPPPQTIEAQAETKEPRRPLQSSHNSNRAEPSLVAKMSRLKRSPSAQLGSQHKAEQSEVGCCDVGGASTSDADNGSLGGQKKSSQTGEQDKQQEENYEEGSPARPPGGAGGPLKNEAQQQQQQQEHYSAPLVWRNIILFVILHSSIGFGARMLWRGQVSYATLAWSVVCIYISGIGVTGGAHRLWSHKAYKARWPIQVLLVALQTMAGQNSVYTWCRDHRVHHKFSETHADPHNIKRGFFFAHMGWLCCKKHPDVKDKGASIDMSDLRANKVVMFQHRNFWWLTALLNVLLPTMVPVYMWNEQFWVSFNFSFMLRYLISLHGTWLVNSAAHYYGSRPYDKRIEARESPFVILTGLGEGFHNYHHTFPYDYSTSEFGRYFNLTTAFIDLCAKLGLAYERRSMSRAVVEQRQKRTGAQKPLPLRKQKQQQQQQQQKKEALVEEDETSGVVSQARSSEQQQRLVSNLIHELPYISGLFSMKYTL